MKRRELTILIASLVFLDGLTFGLALALAYHLRIASGLLPYHGSPEALAYIRTVLLFMPIWFPICALLRLYDPDYLLGGPEEYGQVVKACTLGIVGLTVLSFWKRGALVSRGWLLVSWVLSIIFVGGARFIFRRVIFRLRRQGLFMTRALVVGADEQAKAIARQLKLSVEIVGFVDDYLPPGSRVMDDLRVLGSPTQLPRLAREAGAGELIVVPKALAWESFQEIMQSTTSTLNNFDIKLSPGFYEILTTGVKVTHKAFVPLLTVERVRITGIDALLKVFLDYGLGILLLVLSAPLMSLIALAIVLAGDRPVLERQQVHGLQGRTFETIKFRTGLLGATRRSLVRHVLSELGNNPSHNSSGLGLFLYRMGLDKLPQLFNVLAGQMSLVGPRTISVGSEDRYGQRLPNLLTVKPGMTGPWAIANCPRPEDEIRLAIYYIRNWTIWLDFQIIFRTVRLMLWRRRGEM